MRAKCLFGILLIGIFAFSGCHRINKTNHRENGWYHVLSGQTDSISQEPIVTIKDFVALRLDSDYFGKYVITGQISKHKLNKWADETEKAIGKQIAFLFNDSVITNPQVNDRLESGAFQISSLSDKDLPAIYEQLRKEKIDSIEALFKGWDKDSTFFQLNQEQKDSLRMSLDYWEAKAWIDLTTNPDKHYIK